MRLASLIAFSFVCLAGAVAPAAATSNYRYGPDEYVAVEGGVSPDGRYSIAAHGNGEDGSEDFHLYLMAEPGHAKIADFEELMPWLDTAPNGFDATWSPDSKYVALGYRLDRHLYAINNIYRIEGGRASALFGPGLLHVMGIKAEDAVGVDFKNVTEHLVWSGPGRFRLSGHGTITVTPELARTLGKYGKRVEAPEPRQDDLVFFEYNIEAECGIEGGSYKVLGVKP